MNSLLTSFLSASNPVSSAGKLSEYSLEELSNMTIFERIKISDWTIEKYSLGFIVIFIVLFKIGDYYNTYLVTNFLKALESVIKKNFYQYGVSKNELYVKDSSEAFSSYASGRTNIARMDIKFTLKPRQNLFVWSLEFLFSFFSNSFGIPEDNVQIILSPFDENEYDNFIGAVVSKLGMNEAREQNYFLSLTKTSDSKQLPNSLVFMSEVSEISDNVFTESLKRVLDEKTASYLNYIAFTDQPVQKPQMLSHCRPNRKIIISTKLVSNKESLRQLSNILSNVFETVDKLVAKKITLKPETLKKVVKTREAEISKIKKILEDAKQEELLMKKAEEKRSEREKLRALTEAEQIKLEKKALEKKQKKARRKQMMKM